MENRSQLVNSSREILKSERDIEKVINFLRKKGCSKIQSMLILQDIQNTAPYVAKCQVHFSQTWQDTREYDEQVEELFFTTIEQYDPREDD
ncbi:hypothetical protein AY599_20420 [Leptolyngbya valderiana BDU 20041]|nr:hypothetical protein AY599_20420 [Leptolyngbya valderiana BDU 20041]PPT10162.1 hypothetical protein CKA32_005181 [Geitlerinema sp. FC II]